MGIPFYFWSGFALVVAAVYFFVWPQPESGRERAPWIHFILRWFHSLVWILLAAAGLLFGLNYPAPGNTLALLALGLYAVFMLSLVWDRGKQTS